MTGAGSIRHNNRSFSAANVDRSRTEQNIVFCNEDLKQVYHMVFDEALAAYNAKKTKTRDKIPDYYEHIRQSKQEKLFHEAIFQIGNMSDCGCGTPDGERAAAALKDFAESFAERNPHLRVFNMVLHMDEATPHLHVDFIPVATEQSRGLSTRVSMKQALKQQGFVGVGRKQTEWAAWMEREKEALTEIAQRHDFEIISLGTNRPHMDLPQFKEAAARLEAVQQQTAAVEREVAELERQRDALKGTVRLLKEADRVNAPLHDIQPEKTLTGAVKGVTVDQVEQLKKMALRSVTDRHKVQELTEENTRLRSQVPSMKKRLEEAQRQQRLEQENRRLRDENYYLQSELQEERSFTERLTDGIGRMLDFLEEHLPDDTELTFNTSLLPASSGTVFVSYWDRLYSYSTQNLLKQKGYYTFSMHGNNCTMWNRNNMYPSLGYDKFYCYKDAYNIDDVIGIGLSDKSFFRQSTDIIADISK